MAEFPVKQLPALLLGTVPAIGWRGWRVAVGIGRWGRRQRATKKRYARVRTLEFRPLLMPANRVAPDPRASDPVRSLVEHEVQAARGVGSQGVFEQAGLPNPGCACSEPR